MNVTPIIEGKRTSAPAQTSLQYECITLRHKGVDPIALVQMARATGCADLIFKGFPQMPFHIPEELMTGKTVLVFNEHGLYELIKLETSA